MKKNVLRPVSLFWRGLTPKMRTVLILFLCALLVAGGFGIYLLAREDAPEQTATETLFPGVDRAGIRSVRMVTRSGAEYTVKGSYYSIPDASGNPVQLKRFYLVTPDGVDRSHLTINAEQLSYLVVGTGKNYVYKEVVSRPEEGSAGYAEALAVFEQKKRELGFTDASPYYELTTETGTVYKVYYGIKDVTGDGYYVMMDGADTVYATKSAFIGGLLEQSGPEQLLDATLFQPAENQYAYALAKSFLIRDHRRDNTAGTVVTEDAYAVGYTIRHEDGTVTEGSLALEAFEGESEASRHRREAFCGFFLGKAVGLCDETFVYTYPDTEGVAEEDRGKTYSYHIVSIDHVEYGELRFELSYLDAAERELSLRYSAYAFIAPTDMTSYVPDGDVALSMLENTLGATGTVIRLGMDDAAISKYGLYRHRIEMFYPCGEDTANLDTYALGWLYVSDETEAGTRYVGSLLYDLIVEVDAATFDFLDVSKAEMVENYVVTSSLTDVLTMQIFWNYGSAPHMNDRYTLSMKVEQITNGSESYTDVTSVTATPVNGGESVALDPAIYAQFYSRIIATRYRGEHGLSDEAVAALVSNADACVLRLVLGLSDGVTNYVEFYPISSNRVLVRIKNGKANGVSTDFYIYRTSLEDLARAYVKMAEGESFDFEDRY